MKRIKTAVIAILVFLLFSSMAWVNLTLVKPAVLALPNNIRTIAIIDRTKQEKTKENKIEQVLTGEFFNQDEQAVYQTIEGFIDGCSGINRYTTVRSAERLSSDGNKTTFPSPLNGSKINELCNKYNSDALLSIEIFDSDFMLTHNPVRTEIKNNNGRIVPHIEYNANGMAVINIGIRLYDAIGKTILDEYKVSHRLNWDASGNTIQDAINQVLDKVEAINRTSFEAGQIYAQRISPTYYTVTRYFYNKPKKHLNTGVRKSVVADWKGAIESWEKVLGKKKKVAGRAAYNIAVAYEVLGDLEKAKEWAAKSYTEYGDEMADEYYKILRNRIIDENFVNQQIPDN